MFLYQELNLTGSLSVGTWDVLFRGEQPFDEGTKTEHAGERGQWESVRKLGSVDAPLYVFWPYSPWTFFVDC